MTVDQLLTAVRSTILDDPLSGGSDTNCLWKDDDLLAALDWAQREAAVRAKLITDSATADVAVLTVTAGTGWIPLNESILGISCAEWEGKPLNVTNVGQLNRCYRYWETLSGTPEAYLIDHDRIRLFRKPSADGTLTLTVTREPLLYPVAGANLEVPARCHANLLNGVAHRAYLKQDTQTFDKRAAAENGVLFTQAFGKPISERQQRHYRNLAPVRTALPRF